MAARPSAAAPRQKAGGTPVKTPAVRRPANAAPATADIHLAADMLAEIHATNQALSARVEQLLRQFS